MRRWKKKILLTGLMISLFATAVCTEAAQSDEVREKREIIQENDSKESGDRDEEVNSEKGIMEKDAVREEGLTEKDDVREEGFTEKNDVREEELPEKNAVSEEGLTKEDADRAESAGEMEDGTLEAPKAVLEEKLPGAYVRAGDTHMRSAASSQLQVGWQESLGSIDPGLISLNDPYNVSIKYVDSTDGNNPDMKGKWRMIYCVQYQRNAPEGQINWDGGGRVSPSVAYLLYWGCRYWEKEAVWSGYRTGYGWKYDCLATQYAVHITNGEFSLGTLYNHLKGPKKEHFYSIVQKMVNDSKNSSYYTPFNNGWRNFSYSLSDTSVTWTPQSYNGQEGFTTKWITQKLFDGQTDCSEYITSKAASADNGALVIWKDKGDASDFRIWIPKSRYLLLQITGGKVTASISGNHHLYLAGWVYKSTNPDKYQMVTMLEGGGGNAAHRQSVTAAIPKKNISCYIDLQKADRDTGQTVPQGQGKFTGAVYQVKNREGQIVDKMTTDIYGRAVSAALLPGTYSVKEIKAPPGYLLDETEHVVTFENSDINQTVYRKSIRSEEPPDKGNVKLCKKSAVTGQPLKGAVFRLYNSSNALIGEYTTDAEGMIRAGGLIWGSYYFVEHKAPEGYELSNKRIPFSVDAGTQGKTIELEAVNHIKKVTLELKKEIRPDEINFANGNPIFLFEVKGRDVEGVEHVRHGVISFTPEYVKQHEREDKTVRAGIVFENLPAGIYDAYELQVMRYSLKDITELVNGQKKGEAAVFNLSAYEKGSAVFVNQKDEWGDWSDTSVCENVIPGKEGAD